MASVQEERLFRRLENLRKQRDGEAFLSWVTFYHKDLGTLWQVACNEGSDLSFEDFCSWVYCNTDEPGREMEKDRKTQKYGELQRE